MGAGRLIRRILRLAPIAALAGLGVWTLADVLVVDRAGWNLGLLGLAVVALDLSILGFAEWGAWPRRLGVFLFGGAFFGARLVDLGVEPVGAFAYITLAIVYVELRILSDRFGPVYEGSLSTDARSAIDAALVRQSLRLLVAASLAVFLPILAADLAIAGAVPLRSFTTALLASAGIVAVVVLLALLPVLRRRSAGGGSGDRVQKA